MNEQQQKIKELLEIYAANNATVQQVDELFTLVNNTGDAEMEALLTDILENTEPHYDENRKQRLLKNILRSVKKTPVRKLYHFSRIAAAAVVILLLAIGGYFYFNSRQEKQLAQSDKQIKNDVAPPQSYKAVLTLYDGSTIVLDSAANGSLAVQGNVKVLKTADGKIIYEGDAREVKYNTINNPKGGKPLQLQLADGSNVWLNVGSSITYPTAFIGRERKVQISGEAYFEVVHDASKRFIVQKNDVGVTVLGTHFNVNAYDDESSLRITLLEGSVKVSKLSANSSQPVAILKPGQQAQLNNNEIKIVDADVNEAVAWKNGMFKFQGAKIEDIMRQLERWYDVKVEYKDDINYTLVANISRDVPVSELLKLLEMTNLVHFKIDGKKIIVTK